MDGTLSGLDEVLPAPDFSAVFPRHDVTRPEVGAWVADPVPAFASPGEFVYRATRSHLLDIELPRVPGDLVAFPLAVMTDLLSTWPPTHFKVYGRHAATGRNHLLFESTACGTLLISDNLRVFAQHEDWLMRPKRFDATALRYFGDINGRRENVYGFPFGIVAEKWIRFPDTPGNAACGTGVPPRVVKVFAREYNFLRCRVTLSASSDASAQDAEDHDAADPHVLSKMEISGRSPSGNLWDVAPLF